MGCISGVIRRRIYISHQLLALEWALLLALLVILMCSATAGSSTWRVSLIKANIGTLNNLIAEEAAATNTRPIVHTNYDDDDNYIKKSMMIMKTMMRRRRLIGPGSSPPKCRSKCQKCTPCKPVHVPIQPGLSTPMEYYPEAWRCKCRNKLYMP